MLTIATDVNLTSQSHKQDLIVTLAAKSDKTTSETQ